MSHPYIWNGKEVRTVDEWREASAKAKRKIDRGVSDYEVELGMLHESGHGHPWRPEIALNCMKMQWPHYLKLESDGIQNYWFKRVVTACSKYRYVFMIGAGSSGKSASGAAWIYTLWKAYCYMCSACISSTSRNALQDRAWGTVKEMFAADMSPKIGVRLDYLDAIVLQEDKSDPNRLMKNSIKAIALPKGSEGEKAIGEIQGRKNRYVIWMADEYSHMDGEAIKTARSNLASNQFFQFIACSNKPEEGDPMHIDAEPDPKMYPLGWETPELDRKTSWKTRMGVCLYFDGDMSPNMKVPEGKSVPFPFLSTRRFRNDLVAEDGIEDGPKFWRYWRAFPKSGQVNDRVLDKRILDHFEADKPPVWAADWKCLAGLDLGLKVDGDPCCASFAKVGLDFDGTRVMAHDGDAVVLSHSMVDNRPYDQQVASRFLEQCQERSCHIVALDISGGGGTMALAIRDEAQSLGFKLEVIAVDFSGSPSEEMYDRGDGTMVRARELFDRRVSELWYSYRIAIRTRVVRSFPMISKMSTEFCERRVILDEKRRWKVEKKEDMKHRIKRSPDSADAAVLAHVAARREGLSSKKSDSPFEIAKLPVVSGLGNLNRKAQYGPRTQENAQYAKR